MKIEMTHQESDEILGGHSLEDALTILNALGPFFSAAGEFASALGAVGSAISDLISAFPSR
ncbi:hypothetical protein [Veronia pacifica]|uniref:Uncharacterized protein n=1 Tax=Veronia pacifica TaxID=1080227 RepID=A0A1C3E956_9GAMM|nr:hypothetical protein [Veronia pacifica]ODA29764.1 hypothetical protein A8L45_21805 [Veronia pacifica]